MTEQINKEPLKQVLYSQCRMVVRSRLDTIRKTIQELEESLESETKSTAGDKHETGRAMVQLEREKLGQQLAEIQKNNQVLAKIDVSKSSEAIGLGSIVFTSSGNYFIAISTGELVVDNQKFYAISMSAPIAKVLLGKRVGDEIHFRMQTFRIEAVF
ncbi:GreA/GreB family elongation factor [Snuella sedimenti]|uniref:GreA/GreB family elongation factor n=1 Tax=Snuella sedimenti TaxID=2798802 RepID=A0A8J7IWJ9_9FLAO|nr:GreA/GreB family elongation factor [Snuella sedimenti]MBJ6368410.1 GreA/GreB family elongation factor [Snuella sedimenti]